MKTCSKCKNDFPIDFFRESHQYKDKLFCWCKECEKCYRNNYSKTKKKLSRENWLLKNPTYKKMYACLNKKRLFNYRKDYHKKNHKKNTDRSMIWAANNRARSNQIKSLWKKNNREKINEKIKNRKRSDPSYHLRCIVSKSIWQGLKTNGTTKQSSCWGQLSYTPNELRLYLESQFHPWMNWDNYGIYSKTKRTWQIDHIIPHSNFKYSNMSESNFLECWKLSNLQPLESKLNIEKSNIYYNEK